MGEITMCEKIIVRNRVYRKGELTSKLVMLTSEYDFDSLQNFKKQLGDIYIMKE
jgi:hypothetical protein